MNQDEIWDSHLEELVNYIKENRKYPPSESLLGFWVSHQRYAYAHGKLKSVRIQKLEAIGFIWVVDESTRRRKLKDAESSHFSGTWHDRLKELKEYVQVHGELPTTGKLGVWLYQQRHKWRQGKLPDTYKMELEALGVKFWGGEMVDGSTIRERREEIGISQEQLGILIGMTAMNVSKIERAQVPEEKANHIMLALENARQILAEPSGYEMWARKKRELAAHLRTHDGIYPPRGTKLGEWVAEQRFLKKGKMLDFRRYYQLEQMGFQWSDGGRKEPNKPTNPREAWDMQYEEVKRYAEEHGSFPAPKDGSAGIWLYQQKYRYAHGRLPETRKQQLEEIGVTFEE